MRKLIVMLLFIMLCIFSMSCKIMCNNIVEDKRILVVGEVVGISGGTNQEEKKSGIINTTIENVGIMTGIDLDTNKYAAFSHKISLDNDVTKSKCYEANCFSIDKSKKGNIGKLVASSRPGNEIGNVTENLNKGVFGNILDISKYDNTNSKEVYLGSRYDVKRGDAKIYINLDGKGIKEYSIKIDQIDYLNETKNIHIKLTDNELIEKTGGIVKGMSGTPIVQNGKLVGAINSTLEANSLEAYAIFADKLY